MKGGSNIKELREQLLNEGQRLEIITKKIKCELENAPEGSLRLGTSQGCTQYYHCKEGAPHNGAYISKKEMNLVRDLAQKSYNEKVLRYTEKTSKQISRLLVNYEDDKIEKIYRSENIKRQKLITPIEPTYEQNIEKWMAVSFKGKGFSDGAPVILTNKGIRVRSKSEKILADYFDSLDLVYKYECPLYLENFGNIYPDFTFLSRKTGREIYWEHEGMMDNPEYARTAIQKMETYEKNGIFPGENLILTFETSMTPINSELMQMNVKKYLL